MIEGMDYEKVHKSALELGRVLIEKNPELRDWVEGMFPELRENKDEIIKKALIDFFNRDHPAPDFCGFTWDEIVAWLEKQGEQKPAEWSVIDDEMLKNVIDSIHIAFEYCSDPISKRGYQKELDWLKSLRLKTYWRPSEEQMKALSEAVDEHFDIDGGPLWHLYNDLEKLHKED